MPGQENKTSNFITYNNTNTSYTLPVNMNLSSNSFSDDDDINNNNNNARINSLNDVNYYNNVQKQIFSGKNKQIQYQKINNNLQQMNNNFISSFDNINNLKNQNDLNTTSKNSLDEVDLLKDLLMKNLNAPNDPNYFGICLKCNEKIYGADNGLRAMDQLFHVNCFNCHSCAYPLQGKHFYAMEKKSYCENCYMVLIIFY